MSLAATSSDRGGPPARTVPPPSDDAEPRARMVHVGPIRWHVATMGHGPVALLVHGAGASSHSLLPLMRRLSRRFTVLAPDLPGHARTEIRGTFEPSLPNVAEALRGLVGALELRPELVVGHSAGAAVLTRAILDGGLHPRLAVGLAPALVPLGGLVGAVLRPAAAILGHATAAAFIASRFATAVRVDRILRGTGSALDAQGVESYRRLIARPEHIGGVLSMMASWDVTELFEELSRSDVPFLLVAGRGDRAVPLAQVHDAAARLRYVTVTVVDGTGHLLHEEQPDRISRIILDHIDRQAQP